MIQSGVNVPAPETLLSSAHSMIFSTTVDGVFTYLNHAAERVFAQHADALIGKRKIHD